MIRKTALLEVLDSWQVPQSATGLQKFAHRVEFDYTPRPGYLYVRSRAISSRANDNHDEFPAEEIERSYRSFLGKPVFVNHHNANHRRARGVIVAVALHRDKHPDGKPDTWAEVLMEVDAVKFPKLAKAIIEGRVNRTSMGVDVEESQCTACGNKATDPAQYCQHLPAMKGRKYRSRDRKTGKLKEEIIREICRGLNFFENSLLVEEPADPTAYILGIPDARGMSDHMSPRQASLDVADGLDMYAEQRGYRPDGLPVGQQGLDGSDFGLGQTGRRIAASRQAAPPQDHLGRVRGVGAQRPVQGIHARPKIAGMTDDLSGRDRAVQMAASRTAARDTTGGQDITGPHIGYGQAVNEGLDRSRSCRQNCTYGGTHCVVCHEPVSVNMHRATPDYNSGWHHGDGMKRDHPATPADPEGVITSIPGQLARKEQARREMADRLHSQFEQMSGHPLPRRPRGDEDQMPPDPFLAKLRRTADSMDEKPGEGRVHPVDAMSQHLEASHGAPVMGAILLGQEIFRKLHGRPIHGGYGDEPDDSAPAGERLRWTDNMARSMLDVHRALHYAHQRLHGHRHEDHPGEEGRGERTWPYPNEWSGEDREGNKKGLPHHHTFGDPLVIAPKKLPETPEDWKWLDPGSEVHYPRQESPYIRHPFRDEGEGLREYDKIRERPYNHLHPDRTDEYPNRSQWDTSENPADWHRCQRIYSPDEQDRAFHLNEKHDKREPKRPEGGFSPEYHEKWRAWHDQKEKKGITCPECGAYKYLHASVLPSQIGRPTEQYRQDQREEWQRLTKGKTEPFIPELPHYSSRTAATQPIPPGFGETGFCANCGQRLQPPSERGSRIGNWPSKVPFICNDCYMGHFSMPDVPKGPALDYEDKGGMGSHEVSERFAHGVPLSDIHTKFTGPNPKETRWWTADDALPYSVSMRRRAEISDEEIQRQLRLPGSAQEAQGEELRHKLDKAFMWMYPEGETMEGIRSARNLESGQRLMQHHGPPDHCPRGYSGCGRYGTDTEEEGDQEEPYFEVKHGSEWRLRDYGQSHLLIHHKAGGPEIDQIDVSPQGRYGERPDNLTHEHMHKLLRDWVNNYGEGAAESDPRIRRWRRSRGHYGTLETEAVQYAHPEDHPFFQANPVSHEHIIRTFHESTADERAQGMRWYSDAQHVARMLAHGTGHTLATAAGVLSAYSPRTLWPVNLFNASHALMHPDNPPGPGSGAMGMHSNPARRILGGEHHSKVFSADTAPKTREFAHLIEHGGDSRSDDKAGNHHVVVDRHALSVAAGHRLTAAHGDAPLDKQRYYEHVAEKYRHAAKDLSEATGTEIKPHQLQAITWLVQIRKNQAEDEASATAAAKGRLKLERNSRERWRQHHREFHPHMTESGDYNMHLSRREAPWTETPNNCTDCGRDLVHDWARSRFFPHLCTGCATKDHSPEMMTPMNGPDGERPWTDRDHVRHSESMRRKAYGETKVPPEVNTLRQEECPVCSESQVWTGQRCPVCGYVAPPDMFRDPDTGKAAEVREELNASTPDELQNQGLEVPPGGQGSWPAADAQLMHPDQLTPDGVPGGSPLQGDDETQLDDDEGLAEGTLVCPECGAEFGPDDGVAAGDPCPECGQGTLEEAPPADGEDELIDPEELEDEDADGLAGLDGADEDNGDEAAAAAAEEAGDEDAEDDGDREGEAGGEDESRPAPVKRRK